MVFRRLFPRKPEPDRRVEQAAHFDTPEQGDALIVDQLRNLGANLSLPREVLHYLYLPSESAAAAAADALRTAGYTTQVRPAAGPPGPNPFLVLATAEQVVSIESAQDARETFTALAETHGGEYDGWEAAGTP